MLSKKEFEILVLLERCAGLSQRDIAEQLGISLGSVNKTVKDLSEMKYCDRGVITEEGKMALEPYRVKRAIFIAAGFGSRLAPITFNTPKPLIRVNGTRIIDTLLDAVIAAEIPEIVIVRGYLGEQFDQLLYKYPNVKFVDNLNYNEANNIYSALCVKELFGGAYVLEADLILHNASLIRKYEYESNFLGIHVERTDDWCFTMTKKNTVREIKLGGEDCYQTVGVSFWTEEDGEKLEKDIDSVYHSPGGKERFWEQVPLNYKNDNYLVHVRECEKEDVTEIDTFQELKAVDSLYGKNN